MLAQLTEGSWEAQVATVLAASAASRTFCVLPLVVLKREGVEKPAHPHSAIGGVVLGRTVQLANEHKA